MNAPRRKRHPNPGRPLLVAALEYLDAMHSKGPDYARISKAWKALKAAGQEFRNRKIRRETR